MSKSPVCLIHCRSSSYQVRFRRPANDPISIKDPRKLSKEGFDIAWKNSKKQNLYLPAMDNNVCLIFCLENGSGLCNVLGPVFVDKCLCNAALSGVPPSHFPAASPAQTRQRMDVMKSMLKDVIGLLVVCW
ncbi:protein fam19a1 isoform x3 [Limosa lapponica baueri]|uniref:Protein fam19a1 isoform x3 n=1 Tax=Limosa lapponica baueri TaxID=1758121 RepID=A0A2I0TQV7_LIMLA|nr:protein fam19a1 isoform x3 [Limosa lapponica baueri]